MSKARTLANLISDNAELADGQISVAEVVGAAPTANPTFTGNIGVAGNITNASGNLTLDVAGNIILDADGGEVAFKDGGTAFLEIANSSSDAIIRPTVVDKDLLFNGNDNGGAITALRLDMSEAGAATFNAGVKADNYSFTQNSSASGIQDAIFRSTTGRIEVRAGNVDDMLVIDGATGVIINDGGVDRDFRVESGSYSDMLFVDGGSNYVGIQNSGNLGGQLNIAGTTGIRGHKTSSYKTASMMRPTAFGYSVGTYAVTMLGDGNTQGTVSIGYDPSGNPSGAFTGTGGEMLFRGDMSFYQPNTADDGYVQQIRMINQGGVTINEGGADVDFRVESDNNTHAFHIEGSNGDIQIGKSDGSQNTRGIMLNNYGTIRANSQTTEALHLVRSTAGTIAKFYHNNTTLVGSISVSSSGTTYATTSDRRLKDNIEPIEDATDKLMSMKPVTHTWIANPEAPSVHGFIAQEMQEVVPEAVSGEDGGEEMMSMDYGRITPVLVAALQEATNEIKALKKRVSELEAV